MKTLFKGYPNQSGFNEVERKSIDVEFKYVLQTIECCMGIMSTLTSLDEIRHTMGFIKWEMKPNGLHVYSIDVNGEKKVLLLMTDSDD